MACSDVACGAPAVIAIAVRPPDCPLGQLLPTPLNTAIVPLEVVYTAAESLAAAMARFLPLSVLAPGLVGLDWVHFFLLA